MMITAFDSESIMELNSKQAALILESSEDGEISVNVAAPEMDGLPAAICQAIARKLMSDEKFQTDLMEMLEEEE